MSTQRAHLEIRGLSCATCSETVQEPLSALDGVEEASVNFGTDEGTVTYDPDAVSLVEIYEAIEDAGYEPVSESASVTVMGMTCATCAETTERAVADVPGIVDVDVNAASEEARVEYNPMDADLDAVSRLLD